MASLKPIRLHGSASCMQSVCKETTVLLLFKKNGNIEIYCDVISHKIAQEHAEIRQLSRLITCMP